MATVDGLDGHFISRCCHPSTVVHTTEIALLAALIAEHKVIVEMLDHPDSDIDQILGLLDAHDGAAKAVIRWKEAAALN